MSSRRRSAALIAALALALSPSAAFGQDSGDEQLQDPFEGGSEQMEPMPTPPPATDDPGLPDEPPDEVPAQEESAPAETTQEPSGSSGTGTPTEAAVQAQLPRTGADAALVAMFGAGFVLCGVGLRLRLRDGAALA